MNCTSLPYLNRVLNDLGLELESTLQLLQMLGGEEPPIFQSQFSALLWVETMSQACWLRKPGIERWQQQDAGTLVAAREQILKSLSKLGMISARKPVIKQYGAVFVFGGYSSNFNARLDYLLKLWQQGVRFSRIYLMGSQRQLVREEELSWIKRGKPAIESEMMLAQYQALRTAWPEAMQALPCALISAPNMMANDGKSHCPSTSEVNQYWWKELLDLPEPTRDHCLAELQQPILVVSNQPYLRYQGAIMQRDLNLFMQQTKLAHPIIETVGPEISAQEYAGNILDSLARYIYTEYPILERRYLAEILPNCATAKNGLNKQGNHRQLLLHFSED